MLHLGKAMVLARRRAMSSGMNISRVGRFMGLTFLRTGYVEWHEQKSSWKVYGTHFPPKWASTHSTFIKDE
jgi:hypothetical protein